MFSVHIVLAFFLIPSCVVTKIRSVVTGRGGGVLNEFCSPLARGQLLTASKDYVVLVTMGTSADSLQTSGLT